MNPDPEFVQLMTRHQRPLYGFILSLLPDYVEAEDILQETNLVLMRKSGDFTMGTSFIAWACSVARFEVLGHLRKRRRDRHVFADDELFAQMAETVAEQVVDCDDKRSALHGCLQRLNERHQELLKSFYGDDKSIDQIAAESGRSSGGLRVTLHRVRLTLLDCIQRSLAGARAP